MRKIRYAIIGFSGFAENRIVREGFGLDQSRFSGHPQAELIGATGRTTARRKAATRPGLKWYDSVDALLDDPNVEAVFIATNNLSHAPLAEKALRAGKHCLIEKPITTTLEDAARLQELARARSLSLAVDHMMIENAYNRRAKELIADGAVGPVNDISLHMEFCYGATPQEAAAWRCADPKEIGGPIGDVGSHCLYMAEFLLGNEIASLGCVYTPRTLDLAVENGAIIQFRTHSGIQGTIRVASTSLAAARRARSPTSAMKSTAPRAFSAAAAPCFNCRATWTSPSRSDWSSTTSNAPRRFESLPCRISIRP